jgi:hypothetical protein
MDTRIRELLMAAFDAMHEQEDSDHSPQREEFAFHLHECIDDFASFIAAMSPDADPEKTAQFLVGFLTHVVPHMNAAGALFLGKISDPFVVG